MKQMIRFFILFLILQFPNHLISHADCNDTGECMNEESIVKPLKMGTMDDGDLNLHHNPVMNNKYYLSKGRCLAIIILILGISYSRVRIWKAKRDFTEKKQIRLQIENDNLIKKNKLLELEKQNACSERIKQKLISENMAIRISQLEDESDRLQSIVKKKELTRPVLEAFRERIDMLNGVLAAHIANDNAYSKSYDKWINEIIADKDRFMNSTRLAFCASHPKFMSHLQSKGLSEYELNYVCLYALGLKGKDVGEYIQLKRHYHISSDVRKKLGLSENDTNLGLYIKRMMHSL